MRERLRELVLGAGPRAWHDGGGGDGGATSAYGAHGTGLA